MTEEQKNNSSEKPSYEKPAIEKKLSKDDLEREFLYAGTQTKPPQG